MVHFSSAETQISNWYIWWFHWIFKDFTFSFLESKKMSKIAQLVFLLEHFDCRSDCWCGWLMHRLVKDRALVISGPECLGVCGCWCYQKCVNVASVNSLLLCGHTQVTSSVSSHCLLNIWAITFVGTRRSHPSLAALEISSVPFRYSASTCLSCSVTSSNQWNQLNQFRGLTCVVAQGWWKHITADSLPSTSLQAWSPV